MAENPSEGSSPGPLNLNSILALVTLAGGVWLVSFLLYWSNVGLALANISSCAAASMLLSAHHVVS